MVCRCSSLSLEHAKLEAGVAEAATALAALEETVGTLQQAHEEIEARINAALRDTIEDHCRRSSTIAGVPEAAARESGEVLLSGLPSGRRSTASYN